MRQIELTIDDRTVKVDEGISVFDAARIHGIHIPILCHQQNERPVGVCRMCSVETGEKGSCKPPACAPPSRG